MNLNTLIRKHEIEGHDSGERIEKNWKAEVRIEKGLNQ